MLTKVILDGPMGKKFGKVWELEIKSPGEALRLIEANHPGLKAWCFDAINKYSGYKVLCEYHTGKKEYLDDDTYPLVRELKTIRFTPVVSGAGGGGGRFVLGAALFGLSFMLPGSMAFMAPFMKNIGVSMMLGGIIDALTPTPKVNNGTPSAASDKKTSNYFDGPVNTVQQGYPVQLIYGRVLVGSQVISAAVEVV